jgi:catechol 2,3-dioxygenase-like lactoylglutathione lyase family enzyme
MTVLRIVADIGTADVAGLRQFYHTLFDLEVAMDLGWIVTLSSGASMSVQLSLASDGGSGAPVPDLSMEVDDVDAIYRRAKADGVPIAYDLTDEPWGVRRFFLRDPSGKLLNVLSHREWGSFLDLTAVRYRCDKSSRISLLAHAS